MLINNGVFDSTFGGSPGLGLVAVTLTLSYLWLPYMILPVYAGLERLPDSHLEASEDLGAKPWRTFRWVVWPALLPSVIAARSSPSRSAWVTTSASTSSAGSRRCWAT